MSSAAAEDAAPRLKAGWNLPWKTRGPDCSPKLRCRRLAACITDPEVIERLTALAEEYERRVDASPDPKGRKD
ncbi:hypothetical protein [Bradyrhizobium ottawaense]|jgi:hypothetical protein|uniref:Uncharacterized protein n=1 Tax=Bradyrhizobium elkanii TaxID=29448 RepID=A0ABV4FG74_BRAEL|nr:hypothetical protein [Bradyrhizobium elkanii]MCP1979569.1 hypothetical protein [Bradyrhizobium elkanii]MCS3885657.1 hypothetical protein [Bradyrhizobium elkanii]MCS4215320.1 hypothetical protein [Bradyrhizobium elkanii]MCW2115554.1 hypothetical protein [Bradyrhizobium elkanii]